MSVLYPTIACNAGVVWRATAARAPWIQTHKRRKAVLGSRGEVKIGVKTTWWRIYFDRELIPITREHTENACTHCALQATLLRRLLLVMILNTFRLKQSLHGYSTLCKFGRWRDQLITNNFLFFPSTILASESALPLLGFM